MRRPIAVSSRPGSTMLLGEHRLMIAEANDQERLVGKVALSRAMKAL